MLDIDAGGTFKLGSKTVNRLGYAGCHPARVCAEEQDERENIGVRRRT
jgi:hypothetical protein